jgi:hypothetical protein
VFHPSASNWPTANASSSCGKSKASSGRSRQGLTSQKVLVNIGGVPFSEAFVLSLQYIEQKSRLLYSDAAVILLDVD